MYVVNKNYFIILCSSVFDGNFAPSGAAINLGYYDAQLDNVSFTNHQGSAIRVCIVITNFVIVYKCKQN